MKNIKLIFSLLILIAVTISCSKEDGIDKDTSFLSTATSGNGNRIFDISTNNTGNVKITPTGEGVTSFSVSYGHGTGAAVTVAPGESTTHAYPEGTYTVTIVATDIAGHATTTTHPLTVTYRAPQNITVTKNIVGYKLTISKVTALYAGAAFTVYFGDVANEVGTPLALNYITPNPLDNNTNPDYTGVSVSTLPFHIYPAAGSYNLRVVAKSAGVASSETIIPISIYDPFGLPITFENTNINYFFGTFGNVTLDQIANPFPTGINTSATVGKYLKTVGANTWSGTYSPLDSPIDFALGNKIKVWVYNTNPANIGKKLNIELEAGVAGSGAPANGVGVLKVAFTNAYAWEELIFDFSTITTIPATAKFKQIVLRFNDSAAGTGEMFYIDNIRLTN
jgi:hypothetical protein